MVRSHFNTCQAQVQNAICPLDVVFLRAPNEFRSSTCTRGDVDMSQAQVHDVDLSGFGDVEFQFDRVHTTGGLLKTPMPMQSRKVADKGLFVKMSTNEQWLSAATTGNKYPRGNQYGRRSLIDDLRVHVQDACDGRGALKETVEAEYDPMNEVDCPQGDANGDVNRHGGGAKRARYKGKNIAKHRFLEVDLAMHPPEIVRNSDAKKSILLFIVDRRQIWLRLSDVPWAVKYLYVQTLMKGIPMVADDSHGPGGAPPSSDVTRASSQI